MKFDFLFIFLDLKNIDYIMICNKLVTRPEKNVQCLGSHLGRHLQLLKTLNSGRVESISSEIYIS